MIKYKTSIFQPRIVYNKQIKTPHLLANLGTRQESFISSISENKPNRDVEHQQQKQVMALFSRNVFKEVN